LTLEPPAEQTFVLEYFGLTDLGQGRRNNEDYYLILPDLDLCVLADGVGGHQHGEIAAKLACLTLKEKYLQIQTLSPITDLETALAALKFAIYSAHRAIRQKGIDDPEYQEMGTTLVVFNRFENHLLIAHVGDSRAYLYDNTLTLLTQDHIVYSRHSPKSRSLRSKHYLTQALGIFDFVEPSIQVLPLKEQTQYLLCSDGLSDYIPHSALESFFDFKKPLCEIGTRLLQEAQNRKARDNITFILIRPQFQRTPSVC